MPLSAAPPPTVRDGRRVVAPDVEHVTAVLRFDVAAREATGEAKVDFTAGEVAGHPALDLRQEVDWVRLDGQPLDPSAWPQTDLGGGDGADMRVLDVSLEAGSRHLLEVGYRLDTPAATKAQPIGWVDGGVRFDLWMSDLEPGRYLEMWVPAPLIHDQFTLELRVELLGCERPHTLIANTAGVDAGRRGREWTLCYPAHYVALSPMLVLAPTDAVEVRRSALSIPGRDRSLGLVCASTTEDGDLASCEADIRAWLAYLGARYGRWVHGDTFWAVIWDAPRGMEYDGATTSSRPALEHEVFHSWFGRGVKPARAADGWIDEAFTVWATQRRGEAGEGRFAAEPLGLDEAPVELYPPEPWSRRTAIGAYTDGARLFSGIAALLGGPERLRSAMAEWYQINAGRFVTTDGLAAHLTASSGRDVAPLWARYVHGRG